MSGNPFRRKPQPQPAAPEWYSGDSTSISRQSPPPDTERRPSKVKRVRIQTPPPLSPDSVHEDEEDSTIARVGDETHEGSPPPDPSRIDASALEPAVTTPDALSRNESEDEAAMDEELADNTRKNSATGTTSTVDVPIIKNPFQKTLASMKPGSVSHGSTREDTSATEATGSGAERAAMDVESFKRLLMTGNKDAGPAEPSPAPSSATATTTSSYFTGDNSSSTDASSISRHSVNEPLDEKGGAAPSSDSSEDEAKAPRPVQTEKPKPALPTHRHGKSIGQSRAPEIVRFSDFGPSTEPQAPSIRSTPRPPPPPPARRKNTSEEPPVTKPTEETQNPPLVSSPPPQPRAVPPPPLARRASQKQTAMQSPKNRDPPPQQPAKSTRGPPPPPSRKTLASRQNTAEAFPSPSAFQENEHDPSLASDTPSRSSSISSQQKPAMPPPAPPPRRRRGSSKSSLDQTSTASSTLDSPRHSVQGEASQLETLEREAADRSRKEDRGETVLADMDALQAEIDALRSKYGGRS